MADIEQTTEERISALEREVVELRLQLNQLRAEQRPTDDLRAELARVRNLVVEFSAREEAHEDYVQTRLAVIEADIENLKADVKELKTDVKEIREEMRSGFQELRLAYQELATGQHHILEFLMGKSKMND